MAGKGSPWASEPPERAGRGRAAESALGWAALGDGRPASRAGASPGEPDRHADCSGTPPCPSSARPAGLVRPSALLVLDVHKPHLDNHPGGEASRARTQRRQNRARGRGGTDKAEGAAAGPRAATGGRFGLFCEGAQTPFRDTVNKHTLLKLGYVAPTRKQKHSKTQGSCRRATAFGRRGRGRPEPNSDIITACVERAALPVIHLQSSTSSIS